MEFFVYLGCLGFGLLFTILSAVMSHLFSGGVDHHVDVGTHGHVDAGFDNTGMPGVSIFSPVVISSFITAFGGFGMVFHQIHLNVWASAPLAAVCGLAIAAGAFFMFNTLFEKAQASSEVRIGSLVGKTATVITAIPANGVGEIAYVTGGSRCTAPAREQDGKPVGNGQIVKVTRVSESQFVVSAV
jgi:membrane protein implicated in regulation of membrane protease activity